MIFVYTDGSARQKDKDWIGAYAYAIYYANKAICQLSRNVIPATVNMCELLAVAHGIYECRNRYPNEPITVITDSQYVVNGFSHPLTVKTNKDAWKLLNDIKQNHDVNIKHVVAHSKDVRNKHVDLLAKTKLRSQF